MTTTTSTITAADVVAVTGASYRMLDYYCRRGFIAVGDHPGSGGSRRFTVDDVRVVAVLRAVAATFDRSRSPHPLPEHAAVIATAAARGWFLIYTSDTAEAVPPDRLGARLGWFTRRGRTPVVVDCAAVVFPIDDALTERGLHR